MGGGAVIRNGDGCVGRQKELSDGNRVGYAEIPIRGKSCAYVCECDGNGARWGDFIVLGDSLITSINEEACGIIVCICPTGYGSNQ